MMKLKRKPNNNKQQRPSARQVTTSIPLAIATTTVSTTRDVTVTVHFDEIIGTFTIGSTTENATLGQFEFNPALMPGTRLQMMAQLYTKYRVKPGAAYRVAANLSTSTTGSYVCGFCENPDFIVDKSNIVNSIYSLYDGRISQYYTPSDVRMKVADRNKWYNIDGDSQEVMNTTVGKLLVATLGVPNITGNVEIPILFRGDVEFTGPALAKPITGTSSAYGPGALVSANTSYQSNWQIDTGGAVPIFSAGVFLVTPAWDVVVETGNAGGPDKEQAICNVIQMINRTSNSMTIVLYSDLGAAEVGSRLRVVVTPGMPLSLPGGKLTLLN